MKPKQNLSERQKEIRHSTCITLREILQDECKHRSITLKTKLTKSDRYNLLIFTNIVFLNGKTLLDAVTLFESKHPEFKKQ